MTETVRPVKPKCLLPGSLQRILPTPALDFPHDAALKHVLSSGVFRAVKQLCMMLSCWTHVIIHLSKCIVSTTPRVNPNENQGLWVMKMSLCNSLACNKCPTLVGTLDSEGGCGCVGTGGMGQISVPSAHFCCDPETALKLSNF